MLQSIVVEAHLYGSQSNNTQNDSTVTKVYMVEDTYSQYLLQWDYNIAKMKAETRFKPTVDKQRK